GTVSSLPSSTLIHFRAYAINSAGTGYGSDLTFTTTALTPTISNSGTLSAFVSCSGTVSSSQSFTTSGTNLTANIVVTTPTGFEVSTTSGSGYGSSVNLTPSSGTVSTTTIYVRLTSSA